MQNPSFIPTCLKVKAILLKYFKICYRSSMVAQLVTTTWLLYLIDCFPEFGSDWIFFRYSWWRFGAHKRLFLPNYARVRRSPISVLPHQLLCYPEHISFPVGKKQVHEAGRTYSKHMIESVDLILSTWFNVYNKTNNPRIYNFREKLNL